MVVDDRGRWLLIHRNGRWDLPERASRSRGGIETCALPARSEEETGVRGEVVRPLCETLHAYWFPPTRAGNSSAPTGSNCGHGKASAPQTEEGIERVVWCSPAEAAEHVSEAFPTIRRVAEAMGCGRESPPGCRRNPRRKCAIIRGPASAAPLSLYLREISISILPIRTRVGRAVDALRIDDKERCTRRNRRSSCASHCEMRVFVR